MSDIIIKHYRMTGYVKEYQHFLEQHGCTISKSKNSIYFYLKFPDGTKIDRKRELEYSIAYQITLPDGTKLAAFETKGTDIYSTSYGELV